MAELLASELVTNVVLCGGGGPVGSVVFAAPADPDRWHLRIEVRDSNPAASVAARAPSMMSTGRGDSSGARVSAEN